MFPIVRVVDQVIKQYNAARCEVRVQQRECINRPCMHMLTLGLGMCRCALVNPAW